MTPSPTKLLVYAAAIVGAVFVSCGFFAFQLVFAQENDVRVIQQQIKDRNNKLQELKQEIEGYQKELVEVGQEKKTLQGAINELDLSRKKVSTEIEVTEEEIDTTDLEIRDLEIDIREKEMLIERNIEAVAESLRDLNELENQTFLESLMRNATLSEFWDELAKLQSFQVAVQAKVVTLRELKLGLETAKVTKDQKRTKLSELQDQLTDEKVVLDSTRNQKGELLEVTQNEEEKYQSLLQQKIVERDKFLSELSSLESQLNFILNPSTIPQAGSGVLAWPVEPSIINGRCASLTSALGNPYCITQYFGNTAFSRTTAAYNGHGHNGIDLGIPIGTKILSALSGTVLGVGNTDAVGGCYSWGKWVMVRHNNGLATLYAHLSQISVSQGQTVNTGQIVGYSGNTGFSTGPHLHFSVYASEGVQIQTLGALQASQGKPRTGCSAATMPTAGLEAYLNPLGYL